MLIGPNGSTFPVVMVLLLVVWMKFIGVKLQNNPKLANQLVILVSKTQWRGEVAQEMANCIGREYVLAITLLSQIVKKMQVRRRSLSFGKSKALMSLNMRKF